MTKCIVIGENNNIKNKKKIELFNLISGIKEDIFLGELVDDDFSYFELICLNYEDDLDLIFCYNDPLERSEGILCTGHWNDGVV